MFSQPKIIVATDFSPCSDLALRAADALREKTKGKLLAVHVAHFPLEPEWFTTDASTALLPATFRQDLLKNLQKNLDQQIQRCEVKAEGHVLQGPAQKTLLKFIEESQGEVLVMGHKGAGESLHVMGSFTTRILSAVEIPLLIVNRALEIRKVAGLVETEHPAKKVFSATEELGFLFGAKIEFISVWQDIGALYTGPFPVRPENLTRYTEDEKKKIRKTMEDRIRDFMDPHSGAILRTEVVSDKSVSGALVRILDEEQADLAVLTRNRRNLIEKIFIGSVSRRILDTYRGNFLVLPPEESLE